MKILPKIKTTAITILIVSGTIICYASLATVIGGDKLMANSWNDIVNMVNNQDSKMSALTNNGGIETIIVDGPTIACAATNWSRTDVSCPAGYVLTGGGCYGNCVGIAHPNSLPLNSSSYRCDWWTIGAQTGRTLYTKAICSRVKQ